MGFFNKGMYYSQLLNYIKHQIKMGNIAEAKKLTDKILSELVGVIILSYHEIGYNHNQYSVSPETFEKQMKIIKEFGLEVISYEDIRNEDVDYSKMSVLISFDDARKGVKKYAANILEKYQYPYTLFLTPGYQNENEKIDENERFSEFMTWEEIEKLSSLAEVSIGAHTYSHKALDGLERNNIVEEIERCNREIEMRLGIQVEDFAYPYGRYSDIANEEVNKVYKTASTINVGINNKQTSLHKLRRTVILNMFSKENFMSIINPCEIRAKFEKIREQIY